MQEALVLGNGTGTRKGLGRDRQQGAGSNAHEHTNKDTSCGLRATNRSPSRFTSLACQQHTSSVEHRAAILSGPSDRAVSGGTGCQSSRQHSCLVL